MKSDEPNYKLVCRGDYSIPVPLDVKWLAMDKSGNWYVYRNKPKAHLTGFYAGHFMEENLEFIPIPICYESMNIDPPEPCPWHTQRYWVGD